MAKKPAPGDYFFWADYLADPGVQMSSFGAQGLWARMLCIMGLSTRKGYLYVGDKPLEDNDIPKAMGKPVDETVNNLAELERHGVFSRDRHRTIYCRRMVRDEKRRAASAKGGKKGGRTTFEKQKGIFGTQDHTQTPTQGTTQHPQRNPQEEITHPNPTNKKESLSSSRTVAQADRQNVKNGLHAGKNGKSGRQNVTNFEPGSTTIKDRPERIARFQATLAKTVKGSWITVASAFDPHDHNHKIALELCQAEAKRLGKGWPTGP